MKSVILLAGSLLSLNSYAYSCSAICTQFQNVSCRGYAAEHYIDSFHISRSSESSKSDAFEKMKRSCQSQTPSGLSSTVDLKIYTYRNCGVDLMHRSSVSATIANSCF